MSSSKSRIGISIALCLFAVTAGGCLVVGGKSVEEHGLNISSKTLAQVAPGQTTEAWLLAMLGEPDLLTEVEGQEHVHVLRYDRTVTTAQGGAVFLIWAGGSETTSTTSTFFETVDGVVSRYWTDP